jgi:hypothetical protein
MYDTEAFYRGDVNGRCQFAYPNAARQLCHAYWQCPPERLHEFTAEPPTKVRLVLDGDRVVSVEVLPL